ncbi:MAG TPA: N-acetylmuramoyl-L-alanine amidase [Smithellaceae bacterium]|nr:N-acetylmuramoyl-L-alanine amidase [Smithellaceae bacterium]
MLQTWQKVAVVFFGVLMLCIAGTSAEAQTAKHIVVIDAAHGGDDAGVLGVDGAAEKDVTLAIALALQKELAKGGNVEALLTRNTDQTLSPAERKKIILKANPALVLSLHANGGFGKTAAGFELYYPGFSKDGFTNKKAAGAGSPDKRYLNDTVKLARLVQKNLESLFPRQGRGLREAGIPLAEGLAVPVLVAEIGFITNPDGKKKLTSAKTQAEIAGALAKSFKGFF